MTLTQHIATICASAIEASGVLAITFFVALGLIMIIVNRFRGTEMTDAVKSSRQLIGRGILLGLELLVSADIIFTVAINRTFTSVAILASIVLIRTFLSFTLDVEINGRWPWQKKEETR